MRHPRLIIRGGGERGKGLAEDRAGEEHGAGGGRLPSRRAGTRRRARGRHPKRASARAGRGVAAETRRCARRGSRETRAHRRSDARTASTRNLLSRGLGAHWLAGARSAGASSRRHPLPLRRHVVPRIGRILNRDPLAVNRPWKNSKDRSSAKLESANLVCLVAGFFPLAPRHRERRGAVESDGSRTTARVVGRITRATLASVERRCAKYVVEETGPRRTERDLAVVEFSERDDAGESR